MARILIALALGIGLVSATPALAGDAKAGQTVFKAKCAICHAVTAKAPAGLGPTLAGIVGRKAGSRPGYAYSPAMKASGLTWNAATLKLYLASPQGAVRGTKMPFGGLPSAADRDNVAAYLATLR
jgi:cytochrome c